MMPTKLSLLKSCKVPIFLGLAGVFFLSGCASAKSSSRAYNTASSGKWVLNANACPDLREDRRDRQEDRRDRRVDRGPLDRAEDRIDARENRADERVVRCPASAWTYVGRGKATARPAVGPIYVKQNGTYYRYGTGKKKIIVTVR